MTAAEFTPIFDKLTRAFRLPPSDREPEQLRANIFDDWYRQLKHYHVDAVEAGIGELMRLETETYWPSLGRLIELIKTRLSRYDRQPGKCATCHGSGWLEAPAFKANGLVYTNNLSRCPDCGIPAPTVETHARRTALTDLEAHEYGAGRYARDQMPPELMAKHPEKVINPEFKVWAEALRKKLFGVVEEAS